MCSYEKEQARLLQMLQEVEANEEDVVFDQSDANTNLTNSVEIRVLIGLLYMAGI